MTAMKDALKKRIPVCCRSRVGLVKKRYATEKAAKSAASTYKQEVYACLSGNGYHLRTKRSK